MSRLAVAAAVSSLVLALSSCTCGQHACSAASCPGCCDLSGACQLGTGADACGNAGATCHACTGGSVCAGGACLSPNGLVDSGVDITCGTCVTPTDCAPTGSCVQIGGSDACASFCVNGQCPRDEVCSSAVASDGTQVSVCLPANGSCDGGLACPLPCPSGSTCDQVTAQCTNPGGTGGGTGGGGGGTGGASGTCGVYVSPTTPSTCCHSCTVGSGNCQPNGCYGGWWCDTSSCACHRPPTTCGGSGGGTGGGTGGGAGGGAGGGGGTGGSGGGVVIGGYDGGLVTPTGGTVPHLFFAVVGDTRPPNPDDTAHYPTAIITGIYKAIEAMNPRPQFVVTTGDYMFATPSSGQAAPQMDLYLGARANYSGLVFPAMGNHECTGATAGNCTSPTSGNLGAYIPKMLAPLGKSQPYYALDFTDGQGGTTKFVFVACNYWDSTQSSWLSTELARSTTATFVVRHENLGVSAPCTSQSDSMIRNAHANLLLIGHTHTYTHSGNTLVEGVGGAPITGSGTYGFATVEQLSSGWRVTQYDSSTSRVVDTFTVP